MRTCYFHLSFALLLLALVQLSHPQNLVHGADKENTAESQFTGDEPIEMPPALLQMLHDQLVWDELKLRPKQIEKVVALLRPLDAIWWPSRIQPATDRLAIQRQLTEKLKESLLTVLDRVQWLRLEQLERQALGTRIVLQKDVAAVLQLSEEDHSAFRLAALKTDRTATELSKKVASGSDLGSLQEELQAIKDEEHHGIVDSLSNEQKQKIANLRGEPFDFSAVQRIYPLAPSLELQTSQWLAKALPGNLQDLKGQVVAVHFYAFQCINCKRNLPHYTAWHKDYADQGLVVIGIQTPETSSERDAEKVAAAAVENDIQYPLLMDTESENWKGWGTTMWPTVYLIDKEGFIRTWWQGELNWKGNPGEANFRKHIEALLAE
ncbi:Thiol-disulfide oxidoreductase YkuV [Roseimaritima multifibrata]|uniref:Thiol-disulfide oxidoreductase YkuV n=1 Tax=Roseimaritima multifibrata TaxID=1930274 RepID=A0A517MCA5_9BACT|nr:redoxin domain-containing protein [Roseimaritima multifibrata]QDS92529.1 Thiol-disulfide oxidoreductase YkuV [Roseimaritima multifibrata]